MSWSVSTYNRYSKRLVRSTNFATEKEAKAHMKGEKSAGHAGPGTDFTIRVTNDTLFRKVW